MKFRPITWLEDPVFYGWVQGIFVPKSCRHILLDRYLAPHSHDRFLDLGCGTGLVLDYLPSLDYWGIDSNPKYIEHARKKYGARGRFIHADLCGSPWPVEGKFEHIMAIGLLHHLPDERVTEVLSRAKTFLAPKGKLVTVDGCFEKQQPFLVKRLLQMDRGKHVRPLEGYVELARPIFKQVRWTVERNLLRLPYSHLVLEMSGE